MVGPCLCGDPYCPSCGNPAQAAYEEALEAFFDELRDMGLDEFEFAIFKEVGLAAVEAFRKVEKRVSAKQSQGDALYIQHLEDEVAIHAKGED